MSSLMELHMNRFLTPLLTVLLLLSGPSAFAQDTAAEPTAPLVDAADFAKWLVELRAEAEIGRAHV